MATRLVMLVFATALLGQGCSSSPTTDPVTANRVLEPGDEAATTMLTAAQESQVLEYMRTAAVTDRAERPSAAPHGIRWSDVPSGVYWGGVACEIAIVETQREEGRYRFLMVTVRDEPVELVVERRDPPEILAMRATVGSLGDRAAEAKRLEREVRKALEALGRKPSFE